MTMAPSQSDLSALTVWTTKPKSKLATRLASMGIEVLPLAQDEGQAMAVERYQLSERAAVERRTGSAFLRGIQDKTLFSSAIYMRERYDVAALVVEGQVDYTRTAFHPQAVRGALTSMLVGYGLTVLSTPDLEETAALIAVMARQVQVGIPEISLNYKRKATDLADLQRRVVEMLPGCGIALARDLLQTFGSIERIVRASPSELRTMHGIGAKRAAQIHRVLHAEYASVDTERNLEDAIEANPALLFGALQPPRCIVLLARQHHIYTEDQERHVVDLVFADETANELILVELKRGKLRPEHERQLQRYLDHAHESPLLRAALESGAKMRGVLATVERAGSGQPLRPKNPRVLAQTVDRQAAIDVLVQLRNRRLRNDWLQSQRLATAPVTEP
jgi:ERCC4-type nuclease